MKKPVIQGFKECKLCEGTGDLPNGAFCTNCSGYGCITATACDEGCKFEFEKDLGRCYSSYVCVNCGREQRIDSTD